MEKTKREIKDMLVKLNELYKEYEDKKPPMSFDRSEIEYNNGFYKGRLTAIENVCIKVFGINGEELLTLLSSKK